MANIFDDMMDEEVQGRVAFNENVNQYGQKRQNMFFVNEDGHHTRNNYFSFDNAIEQLENNFNFENNKTYQISFLMPNGKWKGGNTFIMSNNIDFNNVVWTEEDEMLMYDNEGFDGDYEIYGITVLETAGRNIGRRRRK